MSSPAKFKPSQLAPLFTFTALFHGLALVSRFGEVHQLVPGTVHLAILVAHGPLLLIQGYFEGRLDYGKSTVKLPTWMSIKSVPLKLSIALAVAYISVLVLQTWDISIGPVDPNPPGSWPLSKRVFWFVAMGGTMLFPAYLAGAAILIPGLRALTKPFRLVAPWVSLPVLTVIGLGVGWGATAALVSQGISNTVDAFHELMEEPGNAVGAALLLAWLPVLAGMLRTKKKKKKT